MTWHKRLTQAREAKGIKKSAFAKLVGVSPPTVTDWESGETKTIEGVNLIKVCEVLGIAPSWLLHGKGVIGDQSGAALDVAAKPSLVPPTPPPDHIQWVRDEEAHILDIYRCTDDQGRASLRRYAERLPQVLRAKTADNKS